MSSSRTVPPLDLRQVLYFVTVARELSFTRAAERLHVSAPGLSKQIKALERHLRTPLLLRSTRSVRLTAAGEAFAVVGEQLLKDAEAALVRTRDAAGHLDGELAIAALVDSEMAFESYLTVFRTRFPHVEFKVVAMRHAELIDAVAEGHVEAGLTWAYLLRGDEAPRSLATMNIVKTEVLAVMARGHPLASYSSVRRGEALLDKRVALMPREYSPTTYDYVVEQLFGGTPTGANLETIPVQVRVQEALARHVLSGSAVTPLSEPVADLFRERCEIRPFEPRWFLDGCIVWRPASRTAALIEMVATWSERTSVRNRAPDFSAG